MTLAEDFRPHSPAETEQLIPEVTHEQWSVVVEQKFALAAFINIQRGLDVFSFKQHSNPECSEINKKLQSLAV